MIIEDWLILLLCWPVLGLNVIRWRDNSAWWTGIQEYFHHWHCNVACLERPSTRYGSSVQWLYTKATFHCLGIDIFCEMNSFYVSIISSLLNASSETSLHKLCRDSASIWFGSDPLLISFMYFVWQVAEIWVLCKNCISRKKSKWEPWSLEAMNCTYSILFGDTLDCWYL